MAYSSNDVLGILILIFLFYFPSLFAVSPIPSSVLEKASLKPNIETGKSESNEGEVCGNLPERTDKDLGSCGKHAAYCSRMSVMLCFKRCLLIPKYFYAVYGHAEKADLIKGYWNQKSKLGVTTHFQR